MRFDSRDAGTPESVWAAAGLSSLPPLALPARAGRLLVLAAHPDDETLGAGGLIATAAAAGIAVTVVIASDGEASHPHSPTHSPARLARLRRAEVTEALARLHPRAELRFLGLPDSSLAEHADELTRELDSNLDRASGETVLLVTPWTGDRHPDHAACADAGARLAAGSGIEHWQFLIWAWHWGEPHSPELPHGRLRRLPLGADAVEAKRNALAAHVSQSSPLSPQRGDEALLSESMLAHFERPFEVFVTADGAPMAAAADARYFDRLYAEHPDPWDLAERFYERRKRQVLLASLPRQRFQRAFEPGCSIGLLTVELARRCDEVVAWDGAQAALDHAVARAREGDHDAVRIECNRIPTQWPTGRFDLIVLSEIGYYCPDQQQLVRRVDDSLSADGVLVACHWRHPAPDHPVSASEVHAALGRGRQRTVSHVEEDFVLDVWTRDGVSVAAAEGIIG